jgi:PrcB C-terminal
MSRIFCQQRFQQCVALTVVVALFGCSTDSMQIRKEGTEVKILRSESFEICPDGSSVTSNQMLSSDIEWQAFLTRSRSTLNGFAQWNPNFSLTSIAVVRIGTKPSNGYAVSIVEARASEIAPSAKTLVLTVLRKSPSPDTLSSTVITSPCAIVQLDGKGFTQLKVVAATPK